jgi:hypothetical protein
MGNEISVAVVGAEAVGRAADAVSDADRADVAGLTSAAQAALEAMRAALAAWPAPDEVRYAGQPAMVRAAD